ncbi:MAG: GDSL-type esterase/lipase family protein [Acidimicrobiales bacterium]
MRAWRVVLVVLGLLAATVSCSSDDGPTRVLLVGDSVMHQLGDALIDQAPRGVKVRNEAVWGSGLLSPWFVDWPANLNDLLDQYDPDIVVFLFVGNYNFGGDHEYETASGVRIPDRTSPAFFRAWQAQAEHMTERAAEAGAEVAWILPPPMSGPDGQAVVDGLRDVYEQVAEDTGAELIDANDVLARENGSFLARGTNADGESVPLRSPDGVHLAPTGAARLAALVRDHLGL